MRNVTLIAIIVLAAGAARAQPTIEIVDLGGGSFDVQVSELGPGATAWTTAGIRGFAVNNAAFVYTVDPNQGNLLVQDVPRREGRTDVTFVHFPAEQDAWRRFDFRSVPTLAAWGGWHNDHPIALADEIRVAWFDAPGGSSFGAGYVARVVLDVNATGFAAGDVFTTAGNAPVGATVLGSGVVVSTTDVFTDIRATEMTWTVYAVPEPSSLVLLLVDGLRPQAPELALGELVCVA